MEGAATRKFVYIWVFLLALTAVEVILAYLHTPLAIMLAALLGLSFLKAGYIVSWFMHMRWEQRSLRWAIFPLFFFCLAILFAVLPDAQRALVMRP
jgi:cytochrome c oxidase subunit IV